MLIINLNAAKIIFFSTLLLFYNNLYASAGWYAGLLIGPTYINNIKFTLLNLTGSSLEKQLSYKVGVNAGGEIGYHYRQFRIEAQGLFNQNNFETIQIGNFLINNDNLTKLSHTGNTNFWAAIGNVYYDFLQFSNQFRLIPYIGLGVGYAEIKNNIILFYDNKKIFNNISNHSLLIGQGIAGINYSFSDHLSFALDFRYMSTPQQKILNSKVVVEVVNLSIKIYC